MIAEQNKSINVCRAYEFISLIGKEVFRIFDIKDYPRILNVIVDGVTLTSIIYWKCIGCELSFDDFGKTWFLSLDEAQREVDRLNKKLGKKV